jgi:hypothetical protein
MFLTVRSFATDITQFLKAFLSPHDDVELQKDSEGLELLRSWSHSPYERFLSKKAVEGPALSALFCVDGFSYQKPIYLTQGTHTLGPSCTSDFVIKPFASLKDFETHEQLPTSLLCVTRNGLSLQAGVHTRVNGKMVEQCALVDRDILEIGSARFLVLQLT